MFKHGLGKDIITDFDKNSDEVIEVSATIFSDFAAVRAAMTAHHGDAIIETPDHLNSIALKNTTIQSTTAEDFRFV